MKRTFVAIDIAPETRKLVSEYTSRLTRSFPQLRVGWEGPEKLHITLKFLGPTEDLQFPSISDALQRVAGSYGPFEISLGGTGVFPHRGEARVLWLGINDDPILREAAEEVDAEMASLGFGREGRRFSPHVTIARLREPKRSKELVSTHLSSDFPETKFQAREITLFESKLRPGGSVYSRLAVFPLLGD